MALALTALLMAIAGLSFLTGGAAARPGRPHCGYHPHVVSGYTVRLHKHRTSGVFGIYLMAPVRYLEPYGAICIDVLARHNLPLVQAGSGELGSWLEIVHNHRSIFRGFGGRPLMVNPGVVITLLPGTLSAIQRCPACYRLQIWPLGYHGRRPKLSGRL